MFVFAISLFQLIRATCVPECEKNTECIQVGESSFSCLDIGSAILFPAKDRRTLFDLCDGCEFHSVLEIETPAGTLIKKQQSYLGIPIVGSHLVEVINDAGEVVHRNGHILEVGDDLKDVTPTQDIDVLLASYNCEDVDSTLAISFINFKAHLIYDVKCWTELSDESTIGHMWNIEFDAHDGKILSIFDGVDSLSSKTAHGRLLQSSGAADDVFDAIGGNERAGQYQHRFQLARNGDECTYDSEHVYVANNQGSSTQSNETPWSFPCSLLPEQNDAVNGANSPLNDAFAFGLTFWNLYQEWYDMPPLNEKLGLVVHFGEGNAMWDGRKMYFADGDSRYHPYVSVDVVAHEVSHGTTQHNSNLVYRDQSGGINEAFSDMAGATAEFFYFGTTEYEMGNKIRKNSGAMRYMCDPERDGRSIGHVDDYRRGMDVHHSSGVFNKAFCSLAQKPDWNPRKAFHVFLVANRIYWDRNTNFEQGANDAIQASVDLGYGSEDICESFSQVGIVGSGCGGNLTAAPHTSSTTRGPETSTRSTRGPTEFPETPAPSPHDGDCFDRFSICDTIVRIGHCSRMRDQCARSCGYCSDGSTASPSTSTPGELKAIVIFSDVPYSCDVSGVLQTDSTFSFQRGNCVAYHLN